MTLLAQPTKITSLEELRTGRTRLAAKPRCLIANNDGCNCLYFPGNLEPTEPRLDLRKTYLAGPQAGALFCCTIAQALATSPTPPRPTPCSHGRAPICRGDHSSPEP